VFQYKTKPEIITNIPQILTFSWYFRYI